MQCQHGLSGRPRYESPDFFTSASCWITWHYCHMLDFRVSVFFHVSFYPAYSPTQGGTRNEVLPDLWVEDCRG